MLELVILSPYQNLFLAANFHEQFFFLSCYISLLQEDILVKCRVLSIMFCLTEQKGIKKLFHSYNYKAYL